VHSYQTQIPGMRSARDDGRFGGTPIYDALYAEYRRLFRALPGDRTGEEGPRPGSLGALTGLPPLPSRPGPGSRRGRAEHDGKA
jgi:hypothetical protein